MIIKKFFKFQSINESKFFYSEEFEKMIKSIDSPISKFLLEIGGLDFDLTNNYLDIDKVNNDFVTFTPDRKAQEIIRNEKPKYEVIGSYGTLIHSKSNRHIFSRLGYSYEEGTSMYKPNINDVGEYISETTSVSGKRYIRLKFINRESVINAEKLRKVDIDTYMYNLNRQTIKIGRVIKNLTRQYGVNFTDKEIEDFVNKYKSQIDKKNDIYSLFELVEGEDIKYWYNYSNYSDTTGTLWNSCMKYSSSETFNIYVENPNVCKLLILKSKKDDKKIEGRALVWILTDGKTYMDRIYTNYDSDINIFRDYSKNMGWYSRYYNNLLEDDDLGRCYDPDGNEIYLNLSVKLDHSDFDMYPYMDTLRYEHEYSILSIEKNGYIKEFTSTNGGYYTECDECDGTGELGCDECDGEGRVTCSTCDGEGSDYDEGKGCDNCYDGYNDCEYCNDGTVDCNCNDGQILID